MAANGDNGDNSSQRTMTDDHDVGINALTLHRVTANEPRALVNPHLWEPPLEDLIESVTFVTPHPSDISEFSLEPPPKRPGKFSKLLKKASFLKKLNSKKKDGKAKMGEESTPFDDPEELDKILRALYRADPEEASDGDEEEADPSDERPIYFGCDIHAPDSIAFGAVEHQCKLAVFLSGGSLCHDNAYVGGFQYSMPANLLAENPLTDGMDMGSNGHISIRREKEPRTPRFNPLRMHPPDEFYLPPKPCQTMPLMAATKPKRKVHEWIERQREKKAEEAKEGDQAETAGQVKEAEPANAVEQVKEAEPAKEPEQTRHQYILPPIPRADSEIVLSPRILDPGVELAIMQPEVVQSRISTPGMSFRNPGPRASYAEKEVCLATDSNGYGASSGMHRYGEASSRYGNGEAVSSSSRTHSTGVEARANPVRVERYYPRRDFGAHMQAVEVLYRDFIGAMSRGMANR